MPVTATGSLRRRPRAFDVIVVGGLVVALLDIVFAMTFWYLHRDVAPTRILQSVASGVMGAEAYAGGGVSAAFGAALHTLIALGMAAVYWFASARWPVLLRQWPVAGTVYGLGLYVAMNHVIVPLSRAQVGGFDLAWFIASVLAHVLLVALPLAWIAHRSADRR